MVQDGASPMRKDLAQLSVFMVYTASLMVLRSDSETKSRIHDTGVNTCGTHVGISEGAQVVNLG